MTIAIFQSNYIPWKGYFDLINSVDEFILLDEVQYTKQDWRNRNLIKTREGLRWLTIPVNFKNLESRINEVTVANGNWAKEHWKTLQHNYGKAPYFKEYKDFFEDLYLNCKEEYLSKINYKFISSINMLLGIMTKISWSTEFELAEEKNERLISLCKSFSADTYISGPAAKSYINESLFDAEKITVKWMDYSGYDEYPQLYGKFEHGVSILDLIFNTGSDAKNYMKSY